jgi:hypothetical protein
MKNNNGHSFYIPVMGIAFTIDTPLKVARYGISSVIPLTDDILVEEMRKYHSMQNGWDYSPILSVQGSGRAERITAYLNLVKKLVEIQVEAIQKSPFEPGSEIEKYFNLLPLQSPLKQDYQRMLSEDCPERKLMLQKTLRASVKAGSIDVNIMAKIDAFVYNKKGEACAVEDSIALASLRGYANSSLESSVVFSAGFNPRLYGYLENFEDFFPSEGKSPKKKIILKVSDYKSAYVQGKFLAKKGLWVSEFRIESGLNCGGHAFATEGYLLGPILQEFKTKRQGLYDELTALYRKALESKNIEFVQNPEMRLGVQGGIGTEKEHSFLLSHYGVDAAGWGTPFLLVPEATTVDDATLMKLANAGKDDLYLSDISPLGVKFNNLRGNTKDEEKLARIKAGKPGAPCVKEYLISNSELTNKPVCTASRQYQKLKIEQLNSLGLSKGEYETQYNKVVEKSCLCEGLSASAIQKYSIKYSDRAKAVAVCPGPNLAYFSTVLTLEQMVKHIYGGFNALNDTYRPHMFINELQMYVEYLQGEILKAGAEISAKQEAYFENFRKNLAEGIIYYKNLFSQMAGEGEAFMEEMQKELQRLEETLAAEAESACSL